MSHHRLPPASLAILVGAVLVTSCQTVVRPPENHAIASLTERIDKLESGIQGSNSKIETVQTSLETNNRQTIATLEQQRQQAADAVYAAAQANQQNPQKNAYTDTVAEALQIAAANLGGSDAQGMQNAATQLKLRLADTKSDLAQLQTMHTAQLEAAADLQKQLAQEQKTRSDTETQLAQAEDTRNQLQTNLQAAEDARSQAQTTLAGKLEAEKQRLASVAALKRKLMFYLAIAGLLAGLASAAAFKLYPPIGLHLALASGGFFLAAYLVAEVPPWLVLLVVALSVAAIVWAFFVRHHRLSGIANSALGAIQQLKIRAEQGDAVARQAFEKLETDLKNHFGAQAGSLEAEARQRLASIPWLPSHSIAPAPAPAPAATTTPAPVAAPVSATPVSTPTTS